MYMNNHIPIKLFVFLFFIMTIKMLILVVKLKEFMLSK